MVTAAVDALDAGEARVAWPDPATGGISVDERAKRAILLAFRLLPMEPSGAGDFRYHDRVPLKTRLDGVRVVPGAIARWGAYIAPGCVLMPSFVNIGAYVGAGTMVDTWATVGSCAQIGEERPPGRRCRHRRGARAAERGPRGHRGRRVHQLAIAWSWRVPGCGTGAVLGAGTILTRRSHVIDVETGEELPRGEAPPWSVCVGGTRMRKFAGGEFGMPCVLVLKRLPEGSRHDKAVLNGILRDHGMNG